MISNRADRGHSLLRTARYPGRTAWIRLLIALALLSSTSIAPGFAQQSYQKPPKEILDVLDAPVTPDATLSPSRDYLLIAEGLRYPPISDLARPMVPLAGLRIDPATNGLNNAEYFVKLDLIKIADGSRATVALPPNARIGFPFWSPNGKHFVFSNTTESGIELWLGDTTSAKARKIDGLTLNAAFGPAAFGPPARWMADSRTLVVQLIPANRSKPAQVSTKPVAPRIQENSGKAKPTRTLQDLLKTPADESWFDYYASSQLALFDTVTHKLTTLAEPAIYATIEPSPDGRFLLVARVHRPYSYELSYGAFPKEVEVVDLRGRLIHKLASLPLADQIPIGGVPTGPRFYGWRPTSEATLYWGEALDGGDLRQKVPHRDRIMQLDAPFNEQPKEIAQFEARVVNLQWCQSNGLVLVTEFDRARMWVTTRLVNADQPAQPPATLWALSVNDRYNNPGSPVMRVMPNGYREVITNGDFIYLTGVGASSEGERPFLDRFNLKTLAKERLFRSDSSSFEYVITLLDDSAESILTRREREAEPLNLCVRRLAGQHEASLAVAPPDALRRLTHFLDPTPQLRGIKKQIVSYKRADGVSLSFTLYLPAGYKKGTRLPTVLWAYPLEYTDASTAGQILASQQRFTTFTGPSELFFLLRGYAVLDNAAMPVVGDSDTVNNTFVEQIVMNARAAIDKAVELGVTDPERVGVAGHSYGAFMAADLLAHSDLFRAGIAMSGAYNRTLTPFGFQNERRTLWQAPDLYWKVSPFLSADRIKAPLLLIHGEADDNEGTFPLQSERMYQAISGLGGNVRLVMLPYESHLYRARESTEQSLFEMISWFDRYVKSAEPRNAADLKKPDPRTGGTANVQRSPRQ